MKHLIFVYGTLKRGFQRSQLMSKQNYLGVAVSKPKYHMYQMGSFPALVEAEADGLDIHGELYEIDHECLSALDKVEGVAAGLFERKYIELDRVTFVSLPTAQNVFDEYYKGRAVAYFFKKPIEGVPKNCGPFWSLK